MMSAALDASLVLLLLGPTRRSERSKSVQVQPAAAGQRELLLQELGIESENIGSWK